jgi:hypothetical protein
VPSHENLDYAKFVDYAKFDYIVKKLKDMRESMNTVVDATYISGIDVLIETLTIKGIEANEAFRILLAEVESLRKL